MSSSPEKMRNVRRLALFIVPVYLVLAIGFALSPRGVPAGTARGASPTTKILPATATSTEQQAIVVRVIDGDTLDAYFDGKTQRIRLIGINAPETVDPDKPVECFGPQASAKLKNLLPEGSLIWLQNDPSQDDKDKYGRLLRYVSASGPDSDIGLVMIANGFAREYTYKLPYKDKAEYDRAEAGAHKAGQGLWAKAACRLGISPSPRA